MLLNIYVGPNDVLSALLHMLPLAGSDALLVVRTKALTQEVCV